MKLLLIATAFIEGATGFALLFIPSLMVNFLIGSHLTGSVSFIVSRVAGSALVTLAITCWFFRNNENINGLIIALMFYNLAASVILASAGIFEQLSGIALWPAVITHVAMALWSFNFLNLIRQLKSSKH